MYMKKEGRFERVKDTVMRHGMAVAIAGSTALGVEAGTREPAKAPRAETATSMRASVLPLEHPTFGQDAQWFAFSRAIRFLVLPSVSRSILSTRTSLASRRGCSRSIYLLASWRRVSGSQFLWKTKIDTLLTSSLFYGHEKDYARWLATMSMARRLSVSCRYRA